MADAPRPSPKEALQLLKAGNHRFIAGQAEHPRQDYQRLKELSRHGQQPFCAIVACSDSRLPLELMFDCGFGDIFSIRTAGNTFTPAVLAAAEFAVDYFEVPLLVVMGHSSCGAVGVAIAEQQLPASIAPALATLKDAVNQVGAVPAADQTEAVATANVWLTVERLIQRSAALQRRVQSGQTAIAAAMCNTATAKVHWLEQKLS